jgi:hypothetical protein
MMTYEVLTKLIVKDGKRYLTFCQYTVILYCQAQDLNPLINMLKNKKPIK